MTSNLPTTAALPADTLQIAAEWLAEGQPTALATVIATRGSSPRPGGSLLAVADDGRFAGSVSGGCVEGAVIQAARTVLEGGESRLLEFTIDDQQAWDVGLHCGGELSVHLGTVAAEHVNALVTARQQRRDALRIIPLKADVRESVLLGEEILTDEALLEDMEADERRALLRDERCRIREHSRHGPLFLQPLVPMPRLVIIGAVHITQYLAPMARAAGYETIVVDPRSAFAAPDRFPDVTLKKSWPQAAFRELVPDARTAVVTLTHDAKLDNPALDAALESPAFYIGALGSRATQKLRRERLAELGHGPETLDRIHGPVGLHLGGREPAEMAIAIMAEITRVRYLGAAAA